MTDYLRPFVDEMIAIQKENARLHDLSEAVANLIKVKGRHNTEIAYQRLVAAYDKAQGDNNANR